MEFFGIDPDETREIDYGRFVLASSAEWLRRKVKDAQGDEAIAAAGRALSEAEAKLAAYKPGGPRFTIGHIEEAKWVELQGLRLEAEKLEAGSAARVKADADWGRELARWGVRGHAGIKTKGGKDLAFASEEVAFLGGKRAVASAKTLEVYFRSGLTQTVALMVMRAQMLGDDLGEG